MPATADYTPSTATMVRIASRSAERDIAAVRETLLRLRFDWAAVSPELAGQAETTITELDAFRDLIDRTATLMIRDLKASIPKGDAA